MKAPVIKAILSMRERYYDPITPGEIASEVFFSRFHFSRMFSRDTGVSPGRYLRAIRLFEAKRLLLTTSMTVSDIVCSVGYSSVGTFRTRFVQSVGMTPAQYRHPVVDELLVAVAPGFHRLPSERTLRESGVYGTGVQLATGGSVAGTVQLPRDVQPANLLVGLFSDAIPQRGPVAFTAQSNVTSPEVSINNVPDGDWWVLAVAESAVDGPGPVRSYLGTLPEPVTVTDGRITRMSLRMRPAAPTDPPIAVTLATDELVDTDRVAAWHAPALRAVA
ncbi:MAG: helix-turn-helix transcriptional regulator [Micromonosporaceae bacterium]